MIIDDKTFRRADCEAGWWADAADDYLFHWWLTFDADDTPMTLRRSAAAGRNEIFYYFDDIFIDGLFHWFFDVLWGDRPTKGKLDDYRRLRWLISFRVDYRDAAAFDDCRESWKFFFFSAVSRHFSMYFSIFFFFGVTLRQHYHFSPDEDDARSFFVKTLFHCTWWDFRRQNIISILMMYRWFIFADVLRCSADFLITLRWKISRLSCSHCRRDVPPWCFGGTFRWFSLKIFHWWCISADVDYAAVADVPWWFSAEFFRHYFRRMISLRHFRSQPPFLRAGDYFFIFQPIISDFSDADWCRKIDELM